MSSAASTHHEFILASSRVWSPAGSGLQLGWCSTVGSSSRQEGRVKSYYRVDQTSVSFISFYVYCCDITGWDSVPESLQSEPSTLGEAGSR